MTRTVAEILRELWRLDLEWIDTFARLTGDPRAPEERDKDEFQEEVLATRESDRP